MAEGKQGVSLYFSIKEQLLEEILSGSLKVGDQLPTENELMNRFDVSRTTIRLAVQQLELDGYVQKVQGKGTFVTKPKIAETITPHIRTFVEQMNDLGLKSRSKILEQVVVAADLSLAEKLGIGLKDPVVKLSRLRFAESDPIQHSISYIPWKIAPGLIEDDCTNSLFELLHGKYGINLHRSVESIEPVMSDKNVSKLLEIKPNSPAFLLESITYTDQNEPVEYSSSIIRGDRSKFTLERFFNKPQTE